MNKIGKLFVISGPSGAGKGTINKIVLEERNDIIMSVSATTREPRQGEVDGKNYYFISEEEFLKKIDNDEFIEWAKVYGNYYGTLKEEVSNILSTGKNVLLEIDIQGAMQVRENYPEGIFVFVLPPSMSELKTRILGRGSETTQSFQTRFLSAVSEIERIKYYDYYVVNDRVEAATETIKCIVEAETHRVRRDVDELVQKFKGEVIEC